ncbi:MGMT family protein [Shewanella glacialipiscicola]|uniref:Methylated-DNA--protein-cysteine methyltransferase n=1 Tax=Shewanella glacialipiscicola TaxID=614069 RepID=A0ABQ6J3N4_9GAMM|nr:MGMT family protein [Shewanella glacialipiscicola]MCL1084718.1 MGMT family protein [Shewanella glacialipiscicola]GIU08448.1 methylated-DNA--protein-cysteine methyltransferase [Shewanella glacialipiscicola]GMA82334.1 methylated-DNA--protein-cysteine methyltransferase [Shewanella glacialipiscicola]
MASFPKDKSPLYAYLQQDEKDIASEQTKTTTLSPMAKIWHIVAMIPQGKVSSYGKIADYAGLPGRARYVSKALKSAPEHLSLPWHRVLNSQGKISFEKNSHAFQQQMELLRMDGVTVNCGKISLSEYEWRPDLVTLVMAMPF